MDAKLERILVDKYPELFVDYGGSPRETCMAWGCSHGDGWFKILEELCEGLSKLSVPVKFSQIKEKFGGLRAYLDSYTKEADAIVQKAEAKSFKTCEVCGEPGKVRRGGWIQTLCDKCEENKNHE